MDRLATISYDSEKVYVVVMTNGVAGETAVARIESAQNAVEAISNAVKNGLVLANIKVADAAMIIPDNDCITKELDGEGITEKELAMNLPYDFGDYISSGSEGDYIFDYQVQPQAPGTPRRLLGVAALRKKVNAITEIAADAGLRLVRLVPESMAYGDIVEGSPLKEKKCCIITMNEFSTMLRIYNSYENIASHEINESLEAVKVALGDRNLSFTEGPAEAREAVYRSENCKYIFSNMASEVVSALAYYEERGLVNESCPVYVTGLGALVDPLVKKISEEIRRPCQNMSALIKGKVSNELAALMGPALGAGIIR